MSDFGFELTIQATQPPILDLVKITLGIPSIVYDTALWSRVQITSWQTSIENVSNF
ncbi:hypothetical protein Bpfe_030583, partial [Biomphalaria pfeifferi]